MPGKVVIDYTQEDILELVLDDLKENFPNIKFDRSDLAFEVKTKQNYRAEWESGQFRVTIKKQRGF